jgi:putative membrane protein
MTDQPMKQVSRLDELAVERNRLAVERNELAVERNELANERTILAYARTSIMGSITGVTLFKLFPENAAIQVLGWVLVGASVVVVLIGLYRFVRRHKSLLKAHAKPPKAS